jgi:hypothetical protein
MCKHITINKSQHRVHPAYKYENSPEEWNAQYDMLLEDGQTCGKCIHSERCKLIFGGNDNNTSCQFFPNRFASIGIL